MDSHLIQRKLDSLGRCLARIEAKRPADSAALVGDVDLQDILSVKPYQEKQVKKAIEEVEQ
ncbi:hypothetical protein [Haloferula sp. A504]|uniref:hypothetical protein n=1 Tax=Haloferula sp. A504 TaxID=3373601 RepID=UPI0031C64086|nr:hypothetical protein [Verrucomicrobiaceae bacterium E54]